MQKSPWMLAIAALIVLGMVWGPVAAAKEDEMCLPMGNIILEPLTNQAKRASVTFPHAVHFSYSCNQCHHTWNYVEPIGSCSAAGCHDLAEAPMNEDGQPSTDPVLQTRYHKNAFHNMCIGCHLDIKRENQALEASRRPAAAPLMPTGPTGCIQCHPTN
jgi:hypothetical protein